MISTIPTDVIGEIFGHLRVSATCPQLTFAYARAVNRLENRSSLLNAALACRAFVEPALDALWWDMNDLDPLFAVLPTYTSGGAEGRGQFTGPISDADLKRYTSYARRIKAFEVVRPPNIRASVLTQITRRSGNLCLLPSLLYLVSHVGHHSLLYLASPRLQAFSLKQKSPFDTEETANICLFCDIVSRESPALDRLYLTISQTLLALLPFIMMIPQLKELGLEGHLFYEDEVRPAVTIDSNFFPKLKSSSTLKTLILNNLNIVVRKGPLPHPDSTFPVLKTLELSNSFHSIKQVTHLLEITSFPSLQHLDLCTPYSKYDKIDTDILDWRNFYTVLGTATSSAFTSLRVIEEEISGIASPVLENVERRFVCLTKLWVDTEFPLGQRHINTIIQAFPHLHALHLNTNQDSTVGFNGLVDLAKGLVWLDDLKLCIKYNDDPLPDEVPSLDHHLSHLMFYNHARAMDVSDPLTFARCVDKLFPWLVGRKFVEGWLTISVMEKWDMVGRTVDALQDARKIERARYSIPTPSHEERSTSSLTYLQLGTYGDN